MSALGGAGVGRRNMLLTLIGSSIYKSKFQIFCTGSNDTMYTWTVF